jgi:hypothetical protein
MKTEKQVKEMRLIKKLDEELHNNLLRKKVSKRNDININKYKPRGSYRGDSPLDD